MRALERLVGMLEAIGQAAPATASDIALRTGLTLSTTVRLLASLCDESVVERVGDRYHLGTRLLVIAHAAESGNPLVARALPLMDELRDRTGETVSLHVASGTRRVCIAEVQSRHEVRRVLPVGQTMPVNFGTAGEVLMAGMTFTDRLHRLIELGLTEQEAADLEPHLSEVEARGWSMASEDWVAGVSGLAASVQDRAGATIAALIVSGPSQRWTHSEMTRCLPIVLEISARMGAGRSDPVSA